MKKSALATVFLVVLIDLMGFGIVLPLMPFFATEFNASPTMVGVLYAIYSLAQLIFSPIWGSFSDRVGRRPIMLLSTTGAVIAYILFGLSASIGLLFFSRLLAGVMGGNISTAQAYIADVTDKEHRSSGMALIGVAFGVGFVIGPALGGILVSESLQQWISGFGVEWITNAITAHKFALPGFFAALLSFCSFLLVVFKLPETVDQTEPKERVVRKSILSPDFWKGLSSISNTRILPWMLYGMFIQAFGQACLYSALSLYCDKVWGMDAKEMSQQFLFIGAVAIITQGGLIRPLTKRFSEIKLFTVGSTLMGIGLALIPFAPSITALSVVLTIMVFGNSLCTPTLTSLISKAAPEDKVGTVMGTSQSLSGLGRVLGPLWGGAAIGLSTTLPFLTTGLLVTSGIFVGVKMLKNEQ